MVFHHLNIIKIYENTVVSDGEMSKKREFGDRGQINLRLSHVNCIVQKKQR